MYQIIGNPQTRAFRLMWLLEELGQEYEVLPYSPRSPEALALNPSGKVPLLRDGENVIPDSVAASIYLADKHGVLTAPAGSPERARLDSMLCLILDEIEGPLWTKAKHTFALPEEVRVEAARETAKFEYDRGLKVLAVRLGDGPYLMGSNFTYADVILGHCAAWAVAAKMNPPSDEKVTKLFEALLERPARAKALERRALELEKMGS